MPGATQTPAAPGASDPASAGAASPGVTDPVTGNVATPSDGVTPSDGATPSTVATAVTPTAGDVATPGAAPTAAEPVPGDAAPPAASAEPPAEVPSTPAPATPASDGSVFPEGVSTPRIMIVGDSISAGPGCYKKYLDQELQANGITNYEFVGEYDDDCGGGVRHSAVSCTTSGQYAEESFTVPNCFPDETYPGMAPLMASHNPDLVMLQLGVNDVWGGAAPVQPILDNYATLIEQARAHNPNIVVFVAQIQRIITDNCTNDNSTANAEELVMAVPGWAAEISTAESPVFVADLWTNSDPQEADDCVHPNDDGARRMGENWFNALKAVLQ